MRFSVIAAALAPLMAAACHSANGSSPDAPPAAATPAPNGAAARIAALSPPLRAGVMLRAIRDAGQSCQQVTGTTAAPGSSPPAWIATCDDGHRWVVATADDGSATVTDAATLARPS